MHADAQQAMFEGTLSLARKGPDTCYTLDGYLTNPDHIRDRVTWMNTSLGPLTTQCECYQSKTDIS